MSDDRSASVVEEFILVPSSSHLAKKKQPESTSPQLGEVLQCVSNIQLDSLISKFLQYG